ncbi:MAG: peptidase prolyl oligopeptidase active site domain protein [Acidobacteria bacterium]|nr:peptidase prolyl oligopeptidase active site domain protein [Acidobacteriota bacterium]
MKKSALLPIFLFSSICIAPAFKSSFLEAQEKQFTLEQVMSAPFPSDLAAAPLGGKVAWVLNAKGVRNIWLAEPPGYKGRQLTSYSEDDGMEIGELAWTPDGNSLVFTRGGDLEDFGENPNPRSRAEEPKQGIWIVASDGKPRLLTEGHSATISPRSDRAAFINKRDVWWVKLDGSEKAALLLQTKGRSGSLHWSPDGSKLSFVSSRGDHSFVGIYDTTTKGIRYLDPSVDRDSEPIWSRDGKQVAFIRIPTSREAFAFSPKRSGRPWSIHVADVETGVGREVWRADEGHGSVFRGVVADDQLLWSADNRLVFPWEKDGWTHLYSISPSSQANSAVLLTPGEFEVEHVSLSANGKEVIYSSNQGDLDHRHIWLVLTAGSHVAVDVTRGNGIEWAPVATSDGKAFAFLRSDARRPPRASIVMPGSRDPRDLSPETVPNEFPESSLVEPQQVIFDGADGMKIHGQLFLPNHLENSKRHPAVIFFHGGSRRQMLLGWHYMYYYRNAYAMNQYLANQGYIVLSVNYRSGIGYGMEFREALNYGATGGSEFNDVMGAGLYMRSRPDVDPQRLGLWGGSYGGYLTAMGLARASNLFAAGVDMHGVHDWNIVIRNFVPAYDPGANPNAARLAFESSPLSSMKTWRSPVLLIHGDDDRNVPFSETVHLVEALRNQGVEFEQLIFPDEIHDFLNFSDWVRAYRASADFFDRHLKK